MLLAGCDASQPLMPAVDAPSLAASRPAAAGTPSNSLTSTAVSKTQIDVSWVDDTRTETGWELQRSTGGPEGVFTLLVTTSANVVNYSDRGLTASTRYCYRVRSFRRTGQQVSYAALSNTSCSTTPSPPPAPSGADARPANSTAVDLSWVDNSATEDGFRVERSGTSAGPWETVTTTGPNATSHRELGRASEQQACYRVVAFNAHGDSGPSNADCTTPPAGPASLAATAVNRTVDLAWTDNSLVEEAYEVQRAPAEAGLYSAVAALPPNSTTYRDEGLSGNTTYWYRVRAKKDGGFSDFSNAASAVTGNCADGPERVCDNGTDDDCDGFTDSADPDCSNTGCTGLEQECANWADDDCDGLVDGADPDCPAPPCDMGCPSGMACYPDGFCYYPYGPTDSDCASNLCVDEACQLPGGDA
jgi:titin